MAGRRHLCAASPTAGSIAATDRCKRLATGARGPQGYAMNRAWIVSAAVSLVSCSSGKAVVHRFEDDYEAARLEAVRSKLPLAVEVWAPW
jgi:hypothetical protein